MKSEVVFFFRFFDVKTCFINHLLIQFGFSLGVSDKDRWITAKGMLKRGGGGVYFDIGTAAGFCQFRV